GNSHHAGFQRAEEGRGPVDRIGQADEDTLFAAQPKTAENGAEAAHALVELPEGPRPTRIDERRFSAAPGVQVAPQDIGREVVVAGNCHSACHTSSLDATRPDYAIATGEPQCGH